MIRLNSGISILIKTALWIMKKEILGSITVVLETPLELKDTTYYIGFVAKFFEARQSQIWKMDKICFCLFSAQEFSYLSLVTKVKLFSPDSMD